MAVSATRKPSCRSSRGFLKIHAGFTLTELLSVMGIVAVVIAILLPGINRARRNAMVTHCASNLRQVTTAMITYAADNRGKFPPNCTAPAPLTWSDADRIGRYLPWTVRRSTGDVGGPAFTCPSDPNGRRSYSMNVFASSIVDDDVSSPATAATFGPRWSLHTKDASRLILATETWSIYGSSAQGYFGARWIGGLMGDSGRRFGGNGGLSPLVFAGRWNYVNTELPYIRHRSADSQAVGVIPVGAINIGYADGHVAFKRHDELYNPLTGASTGDSMWAPGF